MTENYIITDADLNLDLVKYLMVAKVFAPLSHPDLPQGREFRLISWMLEARGFSANLIVFQPIYQCGKFK